MRRRQMHILAAALLRQARARTWRRASAAPSSARCTAAASDASRSISRERASAACRSAKRHARVARGAQCCNTL